MKSCSPQAREREKNKQLMNAVKENDLEKIKLLLLNNDINLYLSCNNQIYELKEIKLKPIIKEELIKTKKVYIPNKNHPWRYRY